VLHRDKLELEPAGASPRTEMHPFRMTFVPDRRRHALMRPTRGQLKSRVLRGVISIVPFETVLLQHGSATNPRLRLEILKLATHSSFRLNCGTSRPCTAAAAETAIISSQSSVRWHMCVHPQTTNVRHSVVLNNLSHMAPSQDKKCTPQQGA